MDYNNINVILKYLASIFGKVDAAMLIAASMFSISLIITIAIISQGSEKSIFKDGISFWSSQGESTWAEEEKVTDKAEEEIFYNEGKLLQRSSSSADTGVNVMMNSIAPKLTLIMGVIVLGGAYYVAARK